MAEAERWLPMRQAADELNIPYHTLQRLVSQNKIQSKNDLLDSRVRLVEINEVKRAFKVA